MLPAAVSRFVHLILIAFAILPLGADVWADDDPPRPPSLKTVPVPEPADLDLYVRDRDAAVLLGKALFWDMQIGSDGIVACATCHFHAGADARTRNQGNPGQRRVRPDGSPDPDGGWDRGRGLNHLLRAADFPSTPASNDVVGSQGISYFVFRGLDRRLAELLQSAPDPDGFTLQGLNLRRTTARNAPSVINAVFNDRQFWDGHAARVFNGVNGLGDGDPGALVIRADDPGSPQLVRVRIAPASLASQAMTPPTGDVEMAAHDRSFRSLAQRIVTSDLRGRIGGLRPLTGQLVHPADSVLGRFSRWPLPGLRIARYSTLVRRAFQPRWWHARRKVRVWPDGHVDLARDSDRDSMTREERLLEHNFPLFFGLAIALYESTLVADDSPYDRFMDGDPGAISPQAVAGVDVFRSQARGRCINCHEGAELTGASVRRVAESPTRIRNGQALDRGFNNIGVLPTREDPGVGGSDTFGRPLSTVRALVPPPVEPIAVDGAVKVPGLRNVALTAPYFHTGSFLTLRQVLQFYSRGGDVVPQYSLDATVEISPLNVLENTPDELDALEAFLESLTDERVGRQQAPFDHPQLFVPNGAVDASGMVVGDGQGATRDATEEIPAVGRAGGDSLGPLAVDP
ncbi:MAG TPA: cytochrome c peroxidase [Candidatus Eisenbacteria bacterium]|nr:cytochrome c peroxidase [Candidatus Eisenbacteria bacterium]